MVRNAFPLTIALPALTNLASGLSGNHPQISVSPGMSMNTVSGRSASAGHPFALPSQRPANSAQRVGWSRWRSVCVFGRARVATETRLRSLSNRKRSKSILLGGHWLQMVRVHTIPDAAKVIQFQPVGDGAANQFVDNPMRTRCATPKRDLSVTLSKSAIPEPTRLGLVDAGEQVAKIVRHLGLILRGDMRPDVSASRPHFIVPDSGT